MGNVLMLSVKFDQQKKILSQKNEFFIYKYLFCWFTGSYCIYWKFPV